MGIVIYSQKIQSVVPPSRMFKALVLDSQNTLPKIFPEGVKSIELLEGDGGVGSIKKTNYGESSLIKYTKHKIDALDVGSFYCKYTMIESDMFDKIDFVVGEVKFIAAGSGCVCKMKSEYYIKKGCELKDEDVKEGKQKAMGLYNAVEEYLMANPDVCV